MATSAPGGEGLQAGKIAAVVDEPLVVRTNPGTADTSTITPDRLWKGQRVRLLEGPVEADGYPWWRVRIGEIEGWVATEETDGSKPWISPLGNGDILYAAPDLELRLVAPDGADDRPFLSKPLTDLRPVISCGSTVTGSWSPDGSFAVVVDAPACEGSIYRVDAGGTTGTHLADGHDAVISGDGGRIAFAPNVTYAPCAATCPVPDPADIKVVASDGSAAPEGTAASEHGFVALHPSWSPDRRSIAYAGYRLQSVRSDGSQIPPDIYITDEQGDRRIVSNAFDPTWSPDGRWIVFARATTDASLLQLIRVRPDGSDEQVLGYGDSRSIAFSPDGELFATIGMTDQQERYLSVTVFGQPIESGQIVSDADAVAWSPDGNQLAWSSPDGDQRTVWVGGPDGSGANPIAHGTAPAWRPLIGG